MLLAPIESVHAVRWHQSNQHELSDRAQEIAEGAPGVGTVDVATGDGQKVFGFDTRDIADVPAVEVITTTAVHLLSAAAVKVGLADDPATQTDLDEARKLINALAGLITAGAPEISDMHARSLRDGLRSVQLAFREASVIPDPIGQGPGEKWTGPVN